MTPYSQHLDDRYLSAYTGELALDLRTAMRSTRTGGRLRRGIAHALVRMGARMLPDTPDIVAGRIVVLPIPPTPEGDRDVPRAA